MITLYDGITPKLLSMSESINNNAGKVVLEAAAMLKNRIMEAFATGGFGRWKRLSKETIKKKKRSGAKEPEAILKEFYKMRDSIDIKSSEIVTPRKEPEIEKFIKTREKLNEFGMLETNRVFDLEKYLKAMDKFDVLGPVQKRKWSSSVGLFKDTALDPNRVDRGFTHEFGGFETIERKISPVETIVAERLSVRGLKGQSDVVRFDRAIRKKKVGRYRYKKETIYIPQRSFIGMPYDTIEDKLIEFLKDKIGELIE